MTIKNFLFFCLICKSNQKGALHFTIADAVVKLVNESYTFISLEILSFQFVFSFASYLLLYSIELE